MKRYSIICALLLSGVLAVAAPAHAQSAVVANYAAGWNMVGGPPGMDLSGASILYSFGSGSYVPPSGTKATLCTGYWAFFNDPTTVALPAQISPVDQVCPLQGGWNLVGNPFAGTAQLPADVLAYHWNPDTNDYDIVHAIPPGAAVWIEATTMTSVTLHFATAATVPAATLTISDLSSQGPFRVHVGDSVKLVLPAIARFVSTTSSAGLHLEDAGYTGPLSCLGDPSCALSLVNQFWTYRAVAPGTALISVFQACGVVTPSCGGQRQTIEIDIAP